MFLKTFLAIVFAYLAIQLAPLILLVILFLNR